MSAASESPGDQADAADAAEPRDSTLDSLNAPHIARIARLSAVDTVRARVSMAINLDLLLPEERLPTADEIAEAFGVSRSSVVRGLRSLQEEGVLTRRPGRYGGTYVKAGEHHSADGPVGSFVADSSNVHTLIDERAIMEAGFAALAAQHRTDEHLEAMAEHVAAMNSTENWAEFRNRDRAFHREVVAAAHAPLAEPAIARVNRELDPYYLPYSMGLLHDSNDEHSAILEAIRDGDSGRAATLTAAHVQELHDSMYVGLTDETGARIHPRSPA
ncbi:FadR family transcriptional regulator [Leucobacter sp. CSA2]|uniref:FadR family transcriptional regulator n=1 Tax=Leucobacter edaphi TaxID=2796472 RepID=A0A934QCF7_9MICO|nr:FCD domain-containing protein [Leucobacter edaphi]MBK0422085.1 FadR family transcriptional regulator [Leucobacter edaphi]